MNASDWVIKPCPAHVTAYLGFGPAGQEIPCGRTEGHEGNHMYQIEWSDPAE